METMIYQGIAIVLLLTFYTFYIAKCVGIPEEKTTLIIDGIYAWSRNPAFVGFDLLYLGICLVFFNIPLLIISLWAAVMLHLQILQEEAHMEKMCGEEYREYRERTMRYLGRKKTK